jgi:hypothetical protein
VTAELKLHEKNIDELLKVSLQCGLSPNKMLNLIVAVALEELRDADIIETVKGIREEFN